MDRSVYPHSAPPHSRHLPVFYLRHLLSASRLFKVTGSHRSAEVSRVRQADRRVVWLRMHSQTAERRTTTEGGISASHEEWKSACCVIGGAETLKVWIRKDFLVIAPAVLGF